MARATWLVDVLEDAGLTVHPYPGWEKRGKTDLDPVGVMWHHTVTKPSSPDIAVDKVLALTGSSTVPAPLANISTNRDGSVSVIAAGTANHGGAGRWDGVSGNRYFLGDEMKNLGSKVEPWPQVQLDAARHAAAAILTYIGAPAQMLCGHKEYATPAGRKVDPHSLDMDTERLTVAAIMEDDMPTAEEIRQIIWFNADMRDFTTGKQLHAATLLRHARNDAYLARIDAAIARRLAEEAAGRGAALSADEIAAIGKEVHDAFIDELTD
jgi:hypothetical protein